MWVLLFYFNLFSYINNLNIYIYIPAFTKSTRVNSQDYEVKLVDTAGQDEYSIFPTQYSMDIHGYVLVYSITSAKSFEVVQIIYDKLLDITGKVQYVILLFMLLIYKKINNNKYFKNILYI